MDEQKRKYPRANYPCAVTVWRKNIEGEVILANTSNISAGGLCVHLNQKLLPGTLVEVRVEFPGDPKPFKSRGEVLRCDLENEKFFRIAIRFEQLDEAKQSFIQEKVAQIIAEQKKD